ncbi:plasmid mobilization protein [Chryseobacterium flavum]|uniref:plasmid mobilization protein n=1 Tax=Chryseobacterium flavum TaxID=415851 RepID=UPI002FD9541A
MENDFLKTFVQQISKVEEQKNAEQKKKKYFQKLGRKGGLKKKTSEQFSKVISVRFTEKEFEEIRKESEKFKLTFSKYLRLIFTEKELKINEFKTDEILLKYGDNFIKIRNLFRNKEWTAFENKKEILIEIELVLGLIKNYLYQKNNRNE